VLPTRQRQGRRSSDLRTQDTGPACPRPSDPGPPSPNHKTPTQA
jgi:hypothetical protein